MKIIHLVIALVSLTFCFTGNRCFAGGNITATLSPEGVLRVTGDRVGNTCVLLARDGTLLVVGASQTTVNGESAPLTLLLDDVVQIDVTMGGGDDDLRIGIQDMVLANLDVDTGLGKDLVIMFGDLQDVDNRDEMAGVFGDVLLNTGGGEDHVALSSVAIWGATHISSGQSRDTVRLSASDVRDPSQGAWVGIPCDFGDGLSINLGQDDDDLRFSVEGEPTNLLAAAITGDLSVNCGQGDDLLQFIAPATVVVEGTVSLSGGVGLDGLIRAEAIESVFPFEPVGFEF